MSGKSAKRRRKGYGTHAPVRVMTEAELLAGLTELENSPVGTRLMVVEFGGSLAGPARTARSAEHGTGVE
jgi:hypothetical protein